MRKLTLALVAPIVAIASLFPAEPVDATPVAPISIEDAELIERINTLRAQHGQGHLAVNDDLKANAQIWAQSLADRKLLAHQSLGSYMLNMHGRAENVGYGGSVEHVFNLFANSPAHRTNMLNPNYNYVGVGVKRADNGLFFTATEFGQR